MSPFHGGMYYETRLGYLHNQRRCLRCVGIHFSIGHFQLVPEHGRWTTTSSGGWPGDLWIVWSDEWGIKSEQRKWLGVISCVFER